MRHGELLAPVAVLLRPAEGRDEGTPHRFAEPHRSEWAAAEPERAGITLSEAKRAFLIEGDNRVGAVAGTIAGLAEANITVTAAAATAAAGRFGTILLVAPADYEGAAVALEA
jgi:hypothetical protein